MLSLPAIKKLGEAKDISQMILKKVKIKWGEGCKKIEDGENCEGRYLHDFLKG